MIYQEEINDLACFIHDKLMERFEFEDNDDDHDKIIECLEKIADSHGVWTSQYRKFN